MRAGDSSDSDIISKLRSRDQEAVAAAYDRYGRVAYSLFFRITGDAGASEDLVQELFLRLWSRGSRFDAEKGSLGVWLLSIARNMAIDYVRSARAQFAARACPIESLDTLSSSHPSAAPSRIHDIETVRKAFGELGADQKSVMQLAYFEGLSQSQIAERLGEPLGTVKSRMRSALDRLRTALAGAVKR